MAGRRRYPTDLSDTEWELVRPLIPPVKPGGRPAVHQRREIADALAYWLRAGCAWRLLPRAAPTLLTPHAGELGRLLRFVRPYVPQLLTSVVLMICVGASQGLMALLVGPVFDRVLNPASAEAPVALMKIPVIDYTIYLNGLTEAGTGKDLFYFEIPLQ